MGRADIRVAIDIGGTFVDAISFDPADSSVRTWKSPTTPDRPSVGVLAAINGLRYPLAELGTIVHGTTLGLNAILQRKGAAVGLITNAGFEDVLEIARAEVNPQAMYDFNYVPPAPIVPRRFRRGVPGRIGADGTIVTALDEDAVASAATSLVRDIGREALAVCFLHSYANPEHERRAGEIIRSALPDIAVSLSIDVAREYREYERTSTTVLDAFIRPVLSAYFGEIEQALRSGGFGGSLHVMRSGGGAMTVQLAQEAPLTTVLSGPAAASPGPRGSVARPGWTGCFPSTSAAPVPTPACCRTARRTTPTKRGSTGCRCCCRCSISGPSARAADPSHRRMTGCSRSARPARARCRGQPVTARAGRAPP